LEQKIRNYEQGGALATAEVQTITAQRLARENEILRRLLRSVGFDDAFQEQFISAEARVQLDSPNQRSDSSAGRSPLPSLELEWMPQTVSLAPCSYIFDAHGLIR
jgi:hypothetical protein